MELILFGKIDFSVEGKGYKRLLDEGRMETVLIQHRQGWCNFKV